MTMKDIKRGKWYETKQGVGLCLSVGGTRPPSAEFNITHPFPRGRVYLAARDVVREVDQPKAREEGLTPDPK